MTTDAAATGNRSLRAALLVLGGVLWIVVFVLVYQKFLRPPVTDTEDDRTPPTHKPVFHPYELPDFTLDECRGGTVSKSDLLGRPWVVSFVFTRCTGQCPMINNRMKELQRQLKSTNVRLVTISVDPKHDTPQVLKKLAEEILDAPRGRWLFLTGKQEDVYRLILKGFKLAVAQNTGERRQPGNEVTHSHKVLHVDKAGTVVGAYDGRNEFDMARLKQVLKDESRK